MFDLFTSLYLEQGKPIKFQISEDETSLRGGGGGSHEDKLGEHH